jgi:hypothetical protein
MAATITREQSSAANYDAARATHLSWAIAVDFAAKVLRATADWTVSAAAGTSHVVLDTNHLLVKAVRVAGEMGPGRVGGGGSWRCACQPSLPHPARLPRGL